MIDKVDYYGTKDGSQKPSTRKQYALAHANGSVNEDYYTTKDTAFLELDYIRRQLKDYGIPEEYWPILMEREVETVVGSWKTLDV